MDAKSTKFAITTKRTDLKLNRGCITGIILDEKEKITVEAGTLIKVINNSSKYCIVQVMDYMNREAIWENIYDCPQSSLKKVNDDIWPFVIAISHPQRRIQFISNGEQCKFILYLKVNDFVSVSGEPFGNSSLRFDCIIRYIGLVQEIGPGYYFGLELLHLNSGHSPQAENIPFAPNYTSCNPELALIITSDWISQLPSEVKKKFSPRELLCGTLEKARTAIGFNSNSSSSGVGKQSFGTLRRSGSTKKNKKSLKELSSDPQLYLNTQQQDEACKSDDSGNGNENHDSDSTMEWTIGMNSNKTINKDKGTKLKLKKETTTTTVGSNKAIRGRTPAKVGPNSQITIDKVQNSISDNNKIVLDSEEYNEYVENYEKTLERQHEINRYTPPPNSVGILKTAKYRRLTSSPVAGDNLDNCIVASAAKSDNNKMSLDERDIIVIDKADIKESTKNEASLIVVNNPRQQQKEVDLVDVLGGNWPSNASDAAFVLNKQMSSDQSGNTTANNSALATGSNYISSSSNSSVSSYNTTQKIDRNNKSSHIVAARAQVQERNRNRDNQWTQTSGGGDSMTGENSSSGGRSKEKKFKNTIEPPLYDNVNPEGCLGTAGGGGGGGGGGAATLASPEKEFVHASPLPDIPGTSLGVGSMVEVSTDSADDLYGVIRWIGSPVGHKTIYVGVELEDDIDDKRLSTSDGSFNGIRLFKCQEGRGVFVQPNQCSKDRRFVDIDATQGNKLNSKQQLDSKMFGHMECLPVHEDVPPLKILNFDELEEICGKFKGIQGHHNSCYLDATLFSMFTFTSVFDSLLYRPPEPEDISHYVEVQTVLREEIVNPLRKNIYVRADRVMKLRQLLDKLSSVSGLTSEEKDPEEFLNSLLAQIMRAEPFLKLSSGQDAFYYQLFVEKDERLSFPSVQQLFEQSFLSSDIKLKEVPSCLIIQMPRFGKNFKMYPRILPSQVLDVTDIIEDSPRQCTVCGKLAEYECRECFGVLQCGVGLESTAFCRKCLETVHSHAKRANHTAKEISVPHEIKSMAEHVTIPRLFMELFAVVCIETSHYVAFVKAGSGLDAPWCFFDSMADRKGEQNGYNIPEMISVPDLPQWLSEDGARAVNETSSNDKMLPEHAKRLFCDAYMCMYQSTDVMMYR